jgi:hypothetical protein
VPSTLLRSSYERSRHLDVTMQLRECADYLGSPEVLLAELMDAYRLIASLGEPDAQAALAPAEGVDPNEVSAELVLEHFYENQSIDLVTDPAVRFRCVATQLLPLVEMTAAGHDPHRGIDYVGLPDESFGNPILGVVQSAEDTNAYVLFMRLLACLAELAPEPRLAALNEGRLKGSLPALPLFDLHLVMWADGHAGAEDESDHTALHELTRDLVEQVKERLSAETGFPIEIGDVYGLAMDADRFEGHLEVLWRV